MKGKLGFYHTNVFGGPATVSGLTAWYDASDSSTLFGATSGGSLTAPDGTVARMQDKSGFGRHMFRSTTAERPLRKTAIRNGLDILRFDGLNDKMSPSLHLSNFISTSGSTVFVVAMATSAPDDSTDPISNARVFGSQFSSFFGVRSSGIVMAAADSGPFTSGSQVVSSASYSFGTWSVFVARHNGVTLTARINGTDASSVSLSSRGIHPSDFVGFGDTGGGTTRYFAGDVAEIITYNVSLSPADWNAVEAYLMTKWGFA